MSREHINTRSRHAKSVRQRAAPVGQGPRHADSKGVAWAMMHNIQSADAEMIPYVFSFGDKDTWEIAVNKRANGGVARLATDFCRALGPGLKDARPNRRLCIEGVDPADISLVSAICRLSPFLQAQGSIRSLATRYSISERIPVADMAKAMSMHILLMPILGGCIDTGTIPVHGALLERFGSGIVLIGRSGAGKTTCCRRLPKGWTVLGDDLAVLRPSGQNEYCAQPLPTWSAVASGTAQWPCHVNTTVSLKALFLLDQSDCDESTLMGTLQAAAAIHNSAQQALLAHGPRSYWRRRKRLERVLDTAIRIARSVPVYTLRVSLHGRFWEKIEEVLEMGEGDSPLFQCETRGQKTA